MLERSRRLVGTARVALHFDKTEFSLEVPLSIGR